MKQIVTFLALAVLPLSLSAQSKSSVRKPTTSAHRSAAGPSTSRLGTRPATSNTMMTAKPAESVHTTANVPATPVATPAPEPTPPKATEQPIVAASAKPAKATRAAKPAPRVEAKSIGNGESGLRVGFRVGGSGSTATGLSEADLGGAKVESAMGFHAGVVFSIGKRAFTIQPEILYSQYGFKLAAGSDYLQLKTNTVEVPLMLKYTFGQTNTRFFINAGPTATYLLGGKISFKEAGESGEADMEIGPNDGRLNYGGSLGLGVALKAGPGSLHIEARGTYLVTDQANVSLQNGKLSVAYLIPLGGR
ncbi:porin family protein [Fibrella forsythiae]|uniref:Outer membrane beta-barrel protein n=1 Tax=Fibrella forsythiae TaxID=2817061 RepID=A0ABS3JTQ3_9BACT|nr:porin family protein [Fibrella forsythiae]MBO0952574.1 outer membrane beta-barrel protein [Fibrella forsythiae]